MAINRLGIEINHKCNICNTTESQTWYKDKVKEVGFVCAVCYNSVRKAINSIQFTEIKEKKKKIPLVNLMQLILEYMIQTNSDEEFHTVSSIAKELDVNYNSIFRALEMLQLMHQGFFKNYDLKIQRLKTKSNSKRDKLQIINIRKRKESNKD